MTAFEKALERKIIKSITNNYGLDNYDENRFGLLSENHLKCHQKSLNKLKIKPNDLIKKIKIKLKTLIKQNSTKSNHIKLAHKYVAPYSENIQNIWDNISKIDKKLLINLLAYRILGYKKVKLPRNNIYYWNALKVSRTLAKEEDTYNPNFLHYVLKKYDLNPIGYDISLYFSENGVAIDFIIEQYAYKIKNKNVVAVEKGDIVLDVGGCWGDTALYFAHKSEKSGKVYSFEFIPENIKLFDINIELNPRLKPQIELVTNPVSNISNKIIYFKDEGPSSKIDFNSFDEQTGTATTVTIDEFVESNGIKKVDFIKMDIEGAEPLALEGAIETIKKFKPKLAIAIYHSMDDFVNIPNWILGLDLDYEIFIEHYTIHAEETICFAKPITKFK